MVSTDSGDALTSCSRDALLHLGRRLPGPLRAGLFACSRPEAFCPPTFTQHGTRTLLGSEQRARMSQAA